MHRRDIISAVLAAATGSVPAWADDPSCDERTPLSCTDVEKFPDRLICALAVESLFSGETTYANWNGTGFLVGPFASMTAGHVIFTRKRGGQSIFEEADDVLVYPATCLIDGRQVGLFGSRRSMKVEVTDKFGKRSTTWPYKFDMGVVHLACPFEDLRTYMPVRFTYEADEASLGGYPRHEEDGDSSAILPDPSLDGTAWRGEGETNYEDGRVVKYTAKGGEGGSGGPVMEFCSDTTVQAYAVHSGTFTNLIGCDRAGGPWFNEKNRDLVRDWMTFRPSDEELVAAGCPPIADEGTPWSTLYPAFLQNPEWWTDLEQLNLVSPPLLPPPRSSDYQIMQVIENGFYEFAVYRLGAGGPNANRCVQLLRAPGEPTRKQWMPGMPWTPVKSGFLSAEEGTILYAASMARNIGPLQPKPVTLPKDDVETAEMPEIPDDLDTSDDPQEDEIDTQYEETDDTPGDLNGDGIVNAADLGLLIAAWATPSGDLNGDGTTDSSDLGLLIAAWTG